MNSTTPTSPKFGSIIVSIELCGYCNVRLCIKPAYFVSSDLPHTRMASGVAFGMSMESPLN